MRCPRAVVGDCLARSAPLPTTSLPLSPPCLSCVAVACLSFSRVLPASSVFEDPVSPARDARRKRSARGGGVHICAGRRRVSVVQATNRNPPNLTKT